MARVFITGSADGLGQLAALDLIAKGHQVVLHARNRERSQEALAKIHGAEAIVTGDLSNTEETKQLAEKVNTLGTFDAIIHNAAVYNAPAKQLLTVNTLAPFILTCLIQRPKRLIYLSSGLQKSGSSKLDSFKTKVDSITYSDTKLHILMLCKAIARKWADVYANALDPGWVPTKMGGSGAPDDLIKGYETQVWLATSNDSEAKVTGCFFYHQRQKPSNPEADDIIKQERFLKVCEDITGVSFPE